MLRSVNPAMRWTHAFERDKLSQRCKRVLDQSMDWRSRSRSPLTLLLTSSATVGVRRS